MRESAVRDATKDCTIAFNKRGGAVPPIKYKTAYIFLWGMSHGSEEEIVGVWFQEMEILLLRVLLIIRNLMNTFFVICNEMSSYR